MSSAAWVFAGMVWLSFVAVLLTVVWMRRPLPKKPVERDALEAADAALKLRVADLEDKFEHHLKRDANRLRREIVDAQPAQGTLPLDRASRLSILREKVAAQRLNKGA